MVSALTRNAKSTRCQDHSTKEGSVEANLLFGHDISQKIIHEYLRIPGTYVLVRNRADGGHPNAKLNKMERPLEHLFYSCCFKYIFHPIRQSCAPYIAVNAEVLTLNAESQHRNSVSRIKAYFSVADHTAECCSLRIDVRHIPKS